MPRTPKQTEKTLYLFACPKSVKHGGFVKHCEKLIEESFAGQGDVSTCALGLYEENTPSYQEEEQKQEGMFRVTISLTVKEIKEFSYRPPRSNDIQWSIPPDILDTRAKCEWIKQDKGQSPGRRHPLRLL